MCLPPRNGACDAIKSRMACSALLPCALRAAPRRRGFSIAVGSALGVRVPRKTARLPHPPYRSRNRATFKIRLTRPSPMGKVAALVLTEEEKTHDFTPSWFVPLSLFPSAFPLPPTPSAPSPLGRFLGAPKDERTTKTTLLSTTNQAGYSLSANLFAAHGAVRMSPAETVLARSVSALHGGSVCFWA